jgi:hypothetical protein
MVTPEEMIANLRVIAEKKKAENGGADYVYDLANTQSCRYAVAGQPSCIVGHLLTQFHGIDPWTFGIIESLRASEALNSFSVEPYVNTLPYVTLDEEIRSVTGRIADAVQNAQDHGTPWLQAVGEVESRYLGGEFA